MKRFGRVHSIIIGPEIHVFEYKIEDRSLDRSLDGQMFKYYSKKTRELEFCVGDSVTFQTDHLDKFVVNIERTKLCAE